MGRSLNRVVGGEIPMQFGSASGVVLVCHVEVNLTFNPQPQIPMANKEGRWIGKSGFWQVAEREN